MTKHKNLNLFTYLLISLGFALFTVGAVAGIKYCYDYFKEKIDVSDDTDVDEDVTLVDGEKAEQGVSYDMPNNITFSKLSTTSTSSSSDSSTVTISATVGPDYAANKILSWALSWTDGVNHGTVTDYVTITPSTDTLSCDVACTQAFGNQITLTATTTDGSNLSASTSIDYIRRISSITNDSSYSYTGADMYIDDCIDFTSDSVDTLASFGIDYTSGTIYPDIEFDVTLIILGGFFDNWQSIDSDSFEEWTNNYCRIYSEADGETTVADDYDTYDHCYIDLGDTDYFDLGKTFVNKCGFDLLTEDEFRYCLTNSYYFDTFFVFEIDVTVSYNDNTVQTKSTSIYTDYLKCSYSLPVTSLSVDNTSIVF